MLSVQAQEIASEEGQCVGLELLKQIPCHSSHLGEITLDISHKQREGGWSSEHEFGEREKVVLSRRQKEYVGRASLSCLMSHMELAHECLLGTFSWHVSGFYSHYGRHIAMRQLAGLDMPDSFE